MYIYNFFKLNNSTIKNFFFITLSIQLAMWGCVGIDFYGLKIPFLREFLSLIYIFYIPGVIILKILRIHDICSISTILYSIGLSISAAYFLGFVVTIFGPIFGYHSPLTLIPLMIAFTIMDLGLCIICYFRDKKFSGSNLFNLSTISLKIISLLCIIPLITIIGSNFVTQFANTSILMAMLICFALVIFLISWVNIIPENLFPLIIWVFAISLLFHYSLITNYIVGWDIQLEYYLASIIKNIGFWDLTLTGNTNSMLSVTILLPIFSIISNMDLIWVLKFIYPLIFSLVPVTLYNIYREQTNNKVAFFSSILFISFFGFYAEMISLVKQEIAELFLVLFLMVLISKKISNLNRSFLLIIFGFSVILSHYGLSFIFVFTIFFSVSCFFFIKSQLLRKIYIILIKKHLINRINCHYVTQFANRESNELNIIYLLIFFAFLVLWYFYTSSSTALQTPVYAIGKIIENIDSVLKPEYAQGLSLIQKTSISPIHNISKILHLLTQFFIVIGYFISFAYKEHTKFRIDYLLLSFSALLLLICGVIVPFFASAYNTSRLFQITLIFLAPFCVIGGITIFKRTILYLKIIEQTNISKYSYLCMACFFALYLLFNSGWVYELLKDDPTSPTLNRTLDAPFFNDREIIASTWLYSKKNHNIIYTDRYRALLLTGFEGRNQEFITDRIKPSINGSYIYIGTYNIENNEFHVNQKGYIPSTTILFTHNKIYNNHGSQMYI